MNVQAFLLKRRYTSLGMVAILGLAIIGYAGIERVDAIGQISGAVKGPGNETLSTPAQVNCWGPSGGGGTQTQANGEFTFSMNPGSYECRAMPAQGSDWAMSNIVFVQVLDGESTTLNVNLNSAQLKGRFTKSDGTGVRGHVDLFSPDKPMAWADSNDDGYYTLGGVQVGTYTVQAKPGWGVSGLTGADPVEITITSTVQTRDFTLPVAPKTLSGTVTKPDGSVVTNACVNANKMGGAWATANTNSSGAYSLSLSGGSWQVQIHPCGPNVDWIYSDPPVQVDFTNDSATESKTHNLKVTPATATVTGTIKDQNGNNITQGGLDIRNASGSGTNTQINNGTYTARLAAGTYEVRYWMSGFTLPPTSVTVGENETKTLNLVVKAKTAHIKGTVKTANGNAAPNVMVNAGQMCNSPDCRNSDWSNTRTDSSGNFDLLVLGGGLYHVNIGMDFGNQGGDTYVSTATGQVQVNVSTETTTVTPSDYASLNFVVVKADSTIVVRFTAGGQPIGNVNGCAYARPAGTFQEQCSPIQNGRATIKVASNIGLAWEVGCRMGPSGGDGGFSCGSPSSVTVTPSGTVEKSIDLQANNATISGTVYDSSGFPRKNCADMKGAMVFADNAGNHFQGQITESCNYRINLVAGVYHIGTSFPPSSGCMNANQGTPVQAFNSQTVQRNLQCVKADATVTVRLLGLDGKGTQGYVNLDNSDEIHAQREGNRGPGGGEGGKEGFGKPMPCGATGPAGVLKCCSDDKNRSVCEKFAIPDGPNGTKNAWTAAQYCKKNRSVCDRMIQNDRNSGPQPGEFTGPGGCKSETECKTYCSKPENFDECSKFKPPSNAQSVKISSFVRAAATSPSSSGQGAKERGSFDNNIHAGAPTDFNGNATIQVLSGHTYRVCAGLPPQSTAMPPKCQTIDLTKAKTANVVLQLREADASVSGSVTLNNSPVSQGFVQVWCEDGNFSGSPVGSDGKYKVNLVKGTKCHVRADSMDSVNGTFARSDETTLVVDGSTKTYTRNLKLETRGEIPKSVAASGQCSTTMTLTLTNGVTISIPGGGISTSSDGSCTLTASPTIDLMATADDQPEGVGYSIEARDENNAGVKKLLSSATITIPYEIAAHQQGTAYEDALKVAFYDSTAGAYKTLSNCTKDESADQFVCTVDHFSAYTVTNGLGSSKSAALRSVTTSKKNGVTSFTVGKKKVTPFKSACDVTVVTKGVNGTQLIAAASTCEPSVKIYDTNGKSKKTIKTGWRGTNSAAFEDMTKDGNADLALAPVNGTEVWVIDVRKRYKVMRVKGADKNTKLTANAIDFNGSGIDQLVVGSVANNQVNNFKVFSFKKNSFKSTGSPYNAFLTGSNGVIGLSIPKARVSNVTPTTINAKKTSVKLAIHGQNFTPDTTVLIGGVAAKVTYKSSKVLQVAIDATQLSLGSRTVKLINPGGAGTTAKQKVKVK